ncbi:MAG: LamB/YcsF family protein [Desulfobacterota bacterium]|nr:LamB/YcsF family protein [Thermodesulfobacteriota bacterium]
MDIDLNADMGESFGMYPMGNDDAFMKHISSANVACGFHAGDSSVMRKTVGYAKRDGVQVGAHPGLPDLQGFGRREMNLTVDEVYDIVVYQVGALKAFAEAAGLKLHHVKPHGSLYGMAHRREEIAQALCRAVRDIDPALYLYIMKKGLIAEVAGGLGLRCVYELYADLGYDAQGNLVITRHHEAHTPADVAARVVRMVKESRVRAVDGTDIAIAGNSVCVHSDTPGALEIVQAVRRGLEGAGCRIASPPLMNYA